MTEVELKLELNRAVLEYLADSRRTLTTKSGILLAFAGLLIAANAFSEDFQVNSTCTAVQLILSIVVYSLVFWRLRFLW